MNPNIKNIPDWQPEETIVGYNVIYDKLDRPGVYFIYDENQELIYIGKSMHLHKRIAGWRDKGFGEYVSFGFTKSDYEAEKYERWYIANLKPKLNSAYINSPFKDMDYNEIKFTPKYRIDSYVSKTGNPIKKEEVPDYHPGISR